MSSKTDKKSLKNKEDKIRDNSASRLKKQPFLYVFTVIVLVLVSVSFIGVPIISNMLGGNRLVFGSYNGQEIVYIPSKYNYFASQYKQEAASMEQYLQNMNLMNQNLDMGIFIRQAWYSAYQNTVLHMAVLLEVEKNGLWVSKNKLNEIILEYGPYSDENGEFDRKIYQNTPKTERIEVKELFREEILDSMYRTDRFSTIKSKVSSLETEFFKNMAKTERSFSYVSYNFNDLPEDKVIAFAEENPKRYKKMKMSRININSSKQEAEQLRTAIINGEKSFEDIAREHMEDNLYSEMGGDMGWQYYYDLEFQFEDSSNVDSIFNLEKGNLSDVIEINVESQKRWMIFRADSEVTDPDNNDSELISVIKNDILKNARWYVEEYFLEKASGFKTIADKNGFNSACLESDLFPPKSTSFFPINFGDIFTSKVVGGISGRVDELANASGVEDFFIELFMLSESETSEPIALGDYVLVFALLYEKETSESELDSLSEEIKNSYYANLDREYKDYIIDDNKWNDDFENTYNVLYGPQQQ